MTRSDIRSAWGLAEAAVKSFDGSHPLLPHQKNAVNRWQHFTRHSLNPHHLPETQFPKISKMLSDIFFLGELSTDSVLKVQWESIGSRYGSCSDEPPPWPGPRTQSRILLNTRKEVFKSTDFAICVLIHEMAHAFFSTHKRIPMDGYFEEITGWSTNGIERKQCFNSDLGITGHGRAFQHLVKAIEDNIERILGFTTGERGLGRDDGMASELRAVVESFQEQDFKGISNYREYFKSDPFVHHLLPYLEKMPKLLSMDWDVISPEKGQMIRRIFEACQQRRTDGHLASAFHSIREAPSRAPARSITMQDLPPGYTQKLWRTLCR